MGKIYKVIALRLQAQDFDLLQTLAIKDSRTITNYASKVVLNHLHAQAANDNKIGTNTTIQEESEDSSSS